jgi:hypothetical protein
MNQEKLWLEFSALPPQSQQVVLDFIALMQKKQSQPKPEAESSGSLLEETFVGMWANRPEMLDSTTWVRQTRQAEWSQQFEC